MKSLLSGLLVITAMAGCAKAASTDTVKGAESKVVEIHMTKPEPPEESTTAKRKKIANLPYAGHGTCSGEFIDPVGDILTARHCVEGFVSFEVQTADRQLYTAVVVATSPVHDLAIIHIDRSNTDYFNFAKTVTRGQKILVLGSPLAITDTLSVGVIAKLFGDTILLDCGALPGNSGGPVFDEDGNLVGVLNAGFIVMFGVTHLNQAQSLDAARFFVQEFWERHYGSR